MTTEPFAPPDSEKSQVPSAVQRVIAGDPADRPKTSSRDHGKLHADLTRWLAGILPDGAEPELGTLDVPSGNGMSSETLLFEASWNDGGSRASESLVARVAPDPQRLPSSRPTTWTASSA